MKCETNPNNCPIEVTLSLIGGKYKPVILWFLIDHPLHYAELQRLIPKATPKMLSQQLHDLETVVSFIVKLYRRSHQRLCIPSLLLAGASFLFWTQCANGETVIWTGWMFRHHAVKIIIPNNTKIGTSSFYGHYPYVVLC